MEAEKKEEGDFLKGEDTVHDTKNRLQDMKLFPGTYFMSGFTFDIMIKKGAQINKETYNILRKFQHNSFIPHLNFYPESNHGRVVVPLVGVLFQNWMRNEGQGQLIGENGTMTSLFKTMIIDICDLVEKLYQKKILIKNLSQGNLYMAAEVAPRILILVTEVEEMVQVPSKAALWSPVEQIIRWCYAQCNVQPNDNADRYIRFISNAKFTLKSLKNYPENWDTFAKGEYMLSVIAADRKEIMAAIQGAGVLWPQVQPHELKLILEYQEKRGKNYNVKIQFHFINLIRDLYKHFDKLPSNIKLSLGGSREGLINVLERWCPAIWEDLYDVIGWK